MMEISEKHVVNKTIVRVKNLTSITPIPSCVSSLVTILKLQTDDVNIKYMYNMRCCTRCKKGTRYIWNECIMPVASDDTKNRLHIEQMLHLK